jgi:tetratricopeptide (TPR) repeat protein
MSLLMDALKKAEEAKRQAGESPAPGAVPAAPPELTLQPVTPVFAPPGSALPNLSQQHLDSVDADLANVSTSVPPRRRQATPTPALKPAKISEESAEAAERSAVRNVFAVKQPPKSRAPLWILLALVGVATFGIGGYFWWQFQSMSGSSLARPAAPMPSFANLPNQQAPAQPVKVLPEVRQPDQASLPPLAEPVKNQAENSAPFVEKRERANVPATPQQAEADGPIRLSTSRPKQNVTLNRAYDALMADNLNDAKRDYEQVLRSDAKNTDALLGLATIAVRQGQLNAATDLYLSVLEADPKDVTAKAGLINLQGQSDPGASESRLKVLLSGQPESPALHFALGNLYASQTRWSDAQQAYFRAHTAEPENADYLFNLAVSLDHMHQNKLAAKYYQSALNAAEIRSAAFDRNQVRSRVLELRP